jgi:DNA repair exonuclease SbcCD ATPase subunit
MALVGFAGNQMGKSSIIDVITFGLFGKPLRGEIMVKFNEKFTIEINSVSTTLNIW